MSAASGTTVPCNPPVDWTREPSRPPPRRVQIDVGAGRQQRLFVEDRHAFEPPRKKASRVWSCNCPDRANRVEYR